MELWNLYIFVHWIQNYPNWSRNQILWKFCTNPDWDRGHIAAWRLRWPLGRIPTIVANGASHLHPQAAEGGVGVPGTEDPPAIPFPEVQNPKIAKIPRNGRIARIAKISKIVGIAKITRIAEIAKISKLAKVVKMAKNAKLAKLLNWLIWLKWLNWLN